MKIILYYQIKLLKNFIIFSLIISSFSSLISCKKFELIADPNNISNIKFDSITIKNKFQKIAISTNFKPIVLGYYNNGKTIDISDSLTFNALSDKLTIFNNKIYGAKSGVSKYNVSFKKFSLVDSIQVREIEEINVSELSYLSTPANLDAKIVIPVVAINYYPTLNGIDIDTKRAPSFYSLDPITIEDLKKRTIDIISMTKFGIEEGSKFRGYSNSSIKEDVAVKLVKFFNVYEIKKTKKYNPSSQIYDIDFDDLFEKINLKNLVENVGVKEVWISLRPLSVEYPVVKSENLSPENFINVWESNMSSPFTGDISNSSRSNSDLPIYNKSYVVYGYNLHRSFAENLHNRGHQIESQLSYADITPSKELFWNKFVGFTNTSKGYFPFSRVGMTHFPPNTTMDYDWANNNFVESDIEDWTPNGGVKKSINSSRWLNLKYNIPKLYTNIYSENDAQFKWLLYWFQSIPSSINKIYFQNNKLENWWDIFYNWDNTFSKNKSLVENTTSENAISIKDQNFEKALIAKGLDEKLDGFISGFNALRITRLDISESNISDISGIENFLNLEELYCGKNKIKDVNIRNLINLKILSFFGNQYLSSIDLTQNLKLKSINFAGNKLSEIDLSKNLDLEYIEISSNNLLNLDISHNLKISSMNITGNPNLKCIKISMEQLPKVDKSWESNAPFLTNCK